MTPARSLTMSIRIALATLWGAFLVVWGLSVFFDGLLLLRVSPQVSRMAGVAMMAAGAFTFMLGVADRLFPAAGQRLSIFLVEMTTFFVFLGACASALIAHGGGLP